MKRIAFLFFILTVSSSYSQNKTPIIFRLQDKHSIKHIRHYLRHDTLIETSHAIIHISYNKDTLKPYLLLLHGMGANGRSNWYNQIKPLSNEFNLIIPDLIYYGESTSNSKDYSVEFQVQQINEAIEKIGINQKINIAGFSYGGLTSAMFNELYHHKISKMIIIDGPVKFFSSHSADSLARVAGVESMKQIIAPSNLKEFDAMQVAVMSSPFPIGKGMKKKMIKHFFKPHKTIRDAQIDDMITHQTKYQNLNYNLDNTPTLLIWGGKDGVVPESVGTNLHKVFSKTTQLIIYPNAKHDAHFSYTKEVNQAITDFLKN
ncbi:MAG: alpha/beta hydrolase [Bacteroidia bacterium]|nr:alpha/beta hydrolase [Bacteroidia bacterium]